MFLGTGTAKKIIEEIGKVVDYDINLMNEEGLIIASTNPSRINTFHEAAYRIIKDNLKELIVYEDEKYEGCKKGINLPIHFDKKIIGVVGITGEVSEILKYGKIIKKMTEILVLDLFTYYKRNMEEQSRLIFAAEWINGNLNENRAYVEEELKKLNMPSHGSFLVAVVSIPDSHKAVSGEDMSNDWNDRSILEKLTINGALSIQSGEMYIIILRCDHEEDAKCMLQKPLEQIRSSGKNRLICAFGSAYTNFVDVPKSFKEALRVMRLKEAEGNGTYCYDEEIINILLEDTPAPYKLRCVFNVFKACTEEEAVDFSNFIHIYFKCNGSIKSIADRLFIHKNTVQYKINKIKMKTGLDMRVMEDLQQLTLAARWHISGIDKSQ